jgi:alkylation response protein AidB-like acyl-CoA dehydrogenase
MAGPTLIEWGTQAQKDRFLPRILAGEDIWCQGYSEPGAGSDLASLRTRAEDAGDHFVVNGQKVWTSGAHFADWMFLLARTNPDAPKHNGISYLLLDMRTPGITVRPLVLLNGHRHFNEVFFDNVKVPKENLVGQLNQGWKVAITTLMYERSGGGGRGHEMQVGRLVALAKSLRRDGGTAWDDQRVRQELAQLAIECEVLRLTRLRGLTRRLRGEPPGPEGSILKLYGSELGIRIADAAGSLLGMRALVDLPQPEVPDAPRWFNRVVSARQYTLAGGTSEIQRNIIGERVLGLPKG